MFYYVRARFIAICVASDILLHSTSPPSPLAVSPSSMYDGNNHHKHHPPHHTLDDVDGISTEFD